MKSIISIVFLSALFLQVWSMPTPTIEESSALHVTNYTAKFTGKDNKPCGQATGFNKVIQNGQDLSDSCNSYMRCIHCLLSAITTPFTGNHCIFSINTNFSHTNGNGTTETPKNHQTTEKPRLTSTTERLTTTECITEKHVDDNEPHNPDQSHESGYPTSSTSTTKKPHQGKN